MSWLEPFHGLSNELGAQAQAGAAQKNYAQTGLGSVHPMTVAGAFSFAMGVRAEAEQRHYDLEHRVQRSEDRCKSLERQLRLLQLPKNENWSA